MFGDNSADSFQEQDLKGGTGAPLIPKSSQKI